jgi:UDP-N-acetylmuramoylalanine--D-glutamate ligase
VGITGTNGKSTTTALIHHILETAGFATTMGGNIGLPILAQDALPEGGIYVLELSSYQIDLTFSLDCDVAVLLNVTPDHLDRYEGFAGYRASKMRLFELQSLDHVAVFASEDQFGYAAYQDRSSRARDSTLLAVRRDAVNQEHWPALQGPHNAQNAAAAIAACRALGVGAGEIELGLRNYPGLPHRMERVRDMNGVLFVNDSKATNPTATAPALAAFRRIRWICGGQAKTDNLDECAPYFGHVAKAYTIGEAGELFARLLSPHMSVAECETLERAVGAAAAEAETGETVLLSPACASFDQFRDFEARGEQFRELVGAL